MIQRVISVLNVVLVNSEKELLVNPKRSDTQTSGSPCITGRAFTID